MGIEGDAGSKAGMESPSATIRPGSLTALMIELASAPRVPPKDAWEAWLQPGAVVGRLELVREIGRGGFGVVWEARDPLLGRSVAFKSARAGEHYQAAFFAAQASEALGRREEALEAYGAALAVVERHMDLNPDDARAATMRAVALCRLGRREEGLRWGEQATLLDPQDAGVRYNVACLHALEGASERALDELAEVLRAGFGNRDWIQRDPDLASVRDLPRFKALMGQA
jgi:tetratricopeptide (TPR) repeat protein